MALKGTAPTHHEQPVDEDVVVAELRSEQMWRGREITLALKVVD
jgi:hypothetical protein